jgi:hypothetical protein
MDGLKASQDNVCTIFEGKKKQVGVKKRSV